MSLLSVLRIRMQLSTLYRWSTDETNATALSFRRFVSSQCQLSPANYRILSWPTSITSPLPQRYIFAISDIEWYGQRLLWDVWKYFHFFSHYYYLEGTRAQAKEVERSIWEKPRRELHCLSRLLIIIRTTSELVSIGERYWLVGDSNKRKPTHFIRHRVGQFKKEHTALLERKERSVFHSDYQCVSLSLSLRW